MCCLFGAGMAWASEPDYIVSDGKVYIVESVKISPFQVFHGKNDDGRVRFRANEVESYRKNGEVYQRLPEYVDNQPTGREVFMKGLAYRNGYVIYKQTSMAENRQVIEQYYVFRGNDYLLQLDPSTSLQLTQYFSYKD